MAGRSKKKKRPTREKRQNDRRKRLLIQKEQRSIETRRQLHEAKVELARLILQKQEQEKQEWIRRKEENRLMRLERRQRCFEREGKQPWTNSGLVRQSSNQRKKKQIDWTSVNDWNKKFDGDVVDSERTRTIRWL